MNKIIMRLLVGVICLMPGAAFAQSGYKVVVDCTIGVPLAYAVGSTQIPTMLPTGAACGTGTFTANIVGTTSNSEVPQAPTSTNLPTVAYNLGYNPAAITWSPILLDQAGRVQVLNTPNAPRASRNFPGCTVGVASATCLTASTAVNFLQVQNTSATANIACSFTGGAALNSSGSFQLAPGQQASWGPNTTGVPTGALACIASAAATPLFVDWN